MNGDEKGQGISSAPSAVTQIGGYEHFIHGHFLHQRIGSEIGGGGKGGQEVSQNTVCHCVPTTVFCEDSRRISGARYHGDHVDGIQN